MKCCFWISSTISVDGSDFQGEALFRLGEVSHMCLSLFGVSESRGPDRFHRTGKAPCLDRLRGTFELCWVLNPSCVQRAPWHDVSPKTSEGKLLNNLGMQTMACLLVNSDVRLSCIELDECCISPGNSVKWSLVGNCYRGVFQNLGVNLRCPTQVCIRWFSLIGISSS